MYNIIQKKQVCNLSKPCRIDVFEISNTQLPNVTLAVTDCHILCLTTNDNKNAITLKIQNTELGHTTLIPNKIY